MDASEEREEHYNKLKSAYYRELEYMEILTTSPIHLSDAVTAKAQANVIQDQLKVINSLENDMRVAYSALGSHTRCLYFCHDKDARQEWHKVLIKLNQEATPEKLKVNVAQNVAKERDAMKKTLRDLNEKITQIKQQGVAKSADAIGDPRMDEILDFLQKLSAEQGAIKVALQEMKEEFSALKKKLPLNNEGKRKTDESDDECLGPIIDLLKKEVSNAKKKGGELAMKKFKSRSEVKMKTKVEELHKNFSFADAEDIEQSTDDEDAVNECKAQ